MTTPPTRSDAADAPATAPEAASETSLETLPFPLPVAARDSLAGLALGDGFGERWFGLFRAPSQAVAEIEARIAPAESPWYQGPVSPFPPGSAALARTLAARPGRPSSSATGTSRSHADRTTQTARPVRREW